MTSVTLTPLRTSLAQNLLKIWIKQRQLLRVMDRQRETADLQNSAFAIEMVTDGYYLLRKNLSDLTDLDRDLPLAAASDPVTASQPAGTDTTRAVADKTVHGIIAHDIAALNALAADYAELHAEAVSAKASALCEMVLEHSRQLKKFLSNLFPDHLAA